jgi:hypothetical protein
MESKYSLKNVLTSSYIYFNPSRLNALDDIQTLVEHSEYFKFPQINDDNSYTQLTEYIYSYVSKSTLCNGLNSLYVKNSFQDIDAVLIITSKNESPLPNGNIFGFALINFEEDINAIHIDIFCSNIEVKYGGEKIIYSIFELCKILFITKIKLFSVSSAVSFYEKYGFNKKGGVCYKNDVGDEICEMEKIIQNGGTKQKKTKTKRKRKIKTTRTSHNRK